MWPVGTLKNKKFKQHGSKRKSFLIPADTKWTMYQNYTNRLLTVVICSTDHLHHENTTFHVLWPYHTTKYPLYLFFKTVHFFLTMSKQKKQSFMSFFMSSDCTHVQWMTYCEGSNLSLTHSLTPLLARFTQIWGNTPYMATKKCMRHRKNSSLHLRIEAVKKCFTCSVWGTRFCR